MTPTGHIFAVPRRDRRLRIRAALRKMRRFAPVIALLAIGVCAPAAVLNKKLNAPLPADGDVLDFEISNDGLWVVYRADQELDEAVELYSVPVSRSVAPIKLSADLPPGSSVAPGYRIHRDSKRVVFKAPQETTGVDEVFVVPIGGPPAAAIKLSGPLVPGGNVWSFHVSPDGGRVVYAADANTPAQGELFSTPIGGPGSAAIPISPPLIPDGSVAFYKISPDGSRVLLVVDALQDNVHELYSVPIDGPSSAAVKISGPLTPDGDVRRFEISPDSTRVVYEADRFTNEQFELFSVPIEGPAVAGVRLNDPLQPKGQAGDAMITPDSSRVVFRKLPVPGGEVTLHSIPIEGPAGAGTTLTQGLVPDGGVARAVIDRTGTRVVYAGFQETSGVLELYSVPVLGPANASVKLNKPLVSGGDVVFSGFSPSPIGGYVAYLADQEVDNRTELFSVPTVGPAGAGVKLNGALTLDVTGFRFSLDSRRVLYRRNRFVILPSPPHELYVVPTIGPASASFRVSGPMVLGGDVDDQEYDFTPNGEHVVYIADQETNEVFELYVSAATADSRGWELYE